MVEKSARLHSDVREFEVVGGEDGKFRFGQFGFEAICVGEHPVARDKTEYVGGRKER